jgi:tetratricopeptide (TPR) repeat protein
MSKSFTAGILLGVVLSFAITGYAQEADSSPGRTESLETTELVNKGRKLTEEEADKLEEKLRTNPHDLPTRTQLLGYYFLERFKSASARKNRQRHIIWTIQNHPSARIAGLPWAGLNSVIDKDVYDRAKQLWLEQVETYEKNTAILGNAAKFFLITDMDISEDLLKKAQSLQPDNLQWSERLGHLYLLKMQRTSGEARSQVAGQALEQFERSFASTTGERVRSPTHKLQYLAKAAFGAGDMEKARKYATELLDTASHYKNKPDQCSYSYYGHAVHHGNIILGRIALKSGDLKKAKKHLIEAGKTPGSPVLNSFGPNMALAKELLEKGETKVVIKYFQLCSKFWKMKRDRLEKWTAIVKEGEIPNFLGNLYY